MKNLLLLVAFLIGFNMFSQNSGKGFSYQAVARNTDGTTKASENIEIRFSLLLGVNILPASYQETQVTTSDEFGVFAVTIGKGIKATSKSFDEINFSDAHYWLQVEIKDNDIWVEISKSQLLSVPYAEVAGNAHAVPIGSIIPFAGQKENIPDGWKLCNGDSLARIEYQELFKAIGTAWGAPNGQSFRIPDLRGLFLRGVDFDRGHDDNRNSRLAMYPGGNTNQNVGSLQGESYRKHNHGGKTANDGLHTHRMGTGDVDTGSGGTFVGSDSSNNDPNDTTIPSTNSAHSHVINFEGGDETRPDNAYVNYIIKVR